MTVKRKGQINFVGLLVMIFIVAIVGTSLINPIASNVAGASATDGIVGTASEPLISISTLMFIIVLMASVVGLSYLGMRAIGMI